METNYNFLIDRDINIYFYFEGEPVYKEEER